MNVINFFIILLIIMVFIKTRNYKRDVFERLPKKGNELKQLYPMALYLITFLASRQISMSRHNRKSNIERLNIIEVQNDSEILFNIRRVSLIIMILFVAAVFSLLYGMSSSEGVIKAGNQIQRPSYGMMETEVDFNANGTEVKARISPREYTYEEAISNFSKAYEYLLVAMKGENQSLEDVRVDLKLLNYLDEWAIKINWIISDTKLIEMDGKVNNRFFEDDKEESVKLTAIMSYLDCECTYEINVIIKAPVLTANERFIRDLEFLIQHEDEENKTKDSIKLPEDINGVKVAYKNNKTNNPIVFTILGFTTAVLIYLGMDKELDNKMNKRKSEMMVDYSEIVSRLTILSTAGMSIKSAWKKMVNDYEKSISSNEKSRRYAYEEMKITFNEMDSGISEGNAYLNFGKRCNIHQYIKLGSLLEQNVKKGTKGLGKMLEAEALDAFEERKNIAKKLGEEAGTKLLIPMIIMLVIVMVIVMIPAFTSFGV